MFYRSYAKDAAAQFDLRGQRVTPKIAPIAAVNAIGWLFDEAVTEGAGTQAEQYTHRDPSL